MKKVILLLVCLFSMTNLVMADDDRPVEFNRLPAKAQTFIKSHFRHAAVVKVEREDDGFEVRMRNGIEIEFGRNGRWKEITSKREGVPASVIPARIQRQVVKRYGTHVKVVEISREDGEIEVKLSNGKELEFDRESRRVEEDD